MNCANCQHPKKEHLEGICQHDDREKGLCECTDFVEPKSKEAL